MIRLVVADDQALIRAGLRGLLELAGDFEVVAEAGDGAQAIECVQRTQPDLLLLLRSTNLANRVHELRYRRRGTLQSRCRCLLAACRRRLR